MGWSIGLGRAGSRCVIHVYLHVACNLADRERRVLGHTFYSFMSLQVWRTVLVITMMKGMVFLVFNKSYLIILPYLE